MQTDRQTEKGYRDGARDTGTEGRMGGRCEPPCPVPRSSSLSGPAPPAMTRPLRAPSQRLEAGYRDLPKAHHGGLLSDAAPQGPHCSPGIGRPPAAPEPPLPAARRSVRDSSGRFTVTFTL